MILFFDLVKGCPFPGVPKNGIKQGLSYLYNDVITFSCDKCYTLLGHSKRKCLTNGTWSHSQAKCVCKLSIRQADRHVQDTQIEKWKDRQTGRQTAIQTD